MDTKDYIKIFEQSSELLVVIDTNFAIVAASDAFLKTTMTKRENILGRNLFDVFPDNPHDGAANGERIIRASLNRIIKNKTPDILPAVKYDIPKPESEGGGFEVKYWQGINSPVLDEKNNVKYVILRTEDVTENKTLTSRLEYEKKALKLVEDSEKRYNMMLMKSPFAFAVLKGKNMIIDLANDSVKEIWGKGKDLEGKPLLEVLPELKDSEFPGLLDKVYTTGIPFSGEELLAPVFRNDKLEDVYFNFVYQPYLEADETISGVTIIAYEVTEQVIAKKKIEANDERLQNILFQAPAAIAVFDGPQHRFVMANQAYQKQNNRKEKDFLGKSFREVFPELESTGSFELFDSVYATGETFTASEYAAMIDTDNNGISKQHYFNLSLEALKNECKEVYGVMVMAYDITMQVEAKKIIEESEKKYRTLLTSIDQGFTLCEIIRNKEGKAIDFYILEVNPTYEEQTGVSKETVLGKRLIQTFPSLTKWLETYAAVVDNQCPVVSENYFEYTDRWFENKAYPVGKDKFAVLFRDITERKQYESKLTEAKDNAEQKTKTAESAVKAKQQFLSNMSHEIRTPMNSIIGFTNVVLKTDLNTEQKEFINAIKVSGDALLVLINDILDLAKVDAGKMTFEQTPFNLFESVSDMLHVFENKVQEKNLELIKEYDNAIPEVIEGDPMRLRQIILNLVSNAVKFTEKGEITLSILKVKEDEEKITIEFAVTDTGIGIPENKLEYIFEDFGQVAYEDARLFGGTGLGLSIVKQLVEHQGGTVTVKSKIDIGSTFSFTLSFKKKTTITTTTTTIDEAELEKLTKNTKVLVVEDVPLNQLLIKMVLIDFGFQFDIAGNGKIAIEKLQQNNYDIILMDLQMPEMNGFEATKYIRTKMNSQIPIIALTADVTSLDVEKSKTIGMNDYLSKPIDEKLLYDKIIKYLKKSD